MSYPCTGCGSCCNRIDKLVLNLKGISKSDELFFPFKWDENGRCEKLGVGNKCSVYETRPLICNVDELLKRSEIPKEQFYAMNIAACNKMMKEDGLPLKYRIQ